MKYLVLLLLIVGCETVKDSDVTESYLTNGYLCEGLFQGSIVTANRCENVMTGKKVDKIINPSNVFVIKE
jgi:hypothetical protein